MKVPTGGKVRNPEATAEGGTVETTVPTVKVWMEENFKSHVKKILFTAKCCGTFILCCLIITSGSTVYLKHRQPYTLKRGGEAFSAASRQFYPY